MHMHSDWLHGASQGSSQDRFQGFRPQTSVLFPESMWSDAPAHHWVNSPPTLEKSKSWQVTSYASFLTHSSQIPLPTILRSSTTGLNIPFKFSSTISLYTHPTAGTWYTHCPPLHPHLSVHIESWHVPGLIKSALTPICLSIANLYVSTQKASLIHTHLCVTTTALRSCFLSWVYWLLQVPLIRTFQIHAWACVCSFPSEL